MFGGPAQTPTPPPLPDALPPPVSYATGGGKRPAGGKIPGFGSTLLTGPDGADTSNTNAARKSLLGQ